MTKSLIIDLPAQINAEHRACYRAAGEALDHAMRCGDLLGQAKDTCRHGEWQAWLAEHFDGSERLARSYMQLANNRELIESKTEDSAVLTIDGALNLLALPKADSPVNDEIEPEDEIESEVEPEIEPEVEPEVEPEDEIKSWEPFDPDMLEKYPGDVPVVRCPKRGISAISYWTSAVFDRIEYFFAIRYYDLPEEVRDSFLHDWICVANDHIRNREDPMTSLMNQFYRLPREEREEFYEWMKLEHGDPNRLDEIEGKKSDYDKRRFGRCRKEYMQREKLLTERVKKWIKRFNPAKTL